MVTKETIEQQKIINNGPLCAAFLSSGIGCGLLGLFVTLTEAFPFIKKMMIISDSVGPLSGKTTYAVLIWLITWVLLHNRWKERILDFNKVFMITIALITIGLIGTFPPFYELFTV